MAPTKTAAVDRAPWLFPQSPGCPGHRKGQGSCTACRCSLSPVPAQEGGASYLTAVREDDHHAAVQGTVVPPSQLPQSLEHLLQREGCR